MKYKVLNYEIKSATTILVASSINASNLCSILNESTISSLGVTDSIIYSSLDKSKLVSVVNGLITLQNVTLGLSDSLSIQVDDGLSATIINEKIGLAAVGSQNSTLFSAIESIAWTAGGQILMMTSAEKTPAITDLLTHITWIED